MRYFFSGLGMAIVLAVAFYLWARVPDIYPSPSPADQLLLRAALETARAQSIATTRASILAALAGLGAFVTILVNIRNSRIVSDTLRLTVDTFRIQERGHLTDRYSRAIEQLGSEAVSVRLGGIYSLELVSVESATSTDRQAVADVLSAHVRHRYPATPYVEAEPGSPPEPDEPVPPPTHSSSIEVLAALTVLGRLPARPGAHRADLWRTKMAGYTCFGINLSDSDLTEVDLRRSRFTRCNFSRTLLGFARLNNVQFQGCTFENVIFEKTRASLANFMECDLVGARMGSADFNRAIFASAKLLRIDGHGCDFSWANFNYANLCGAYLTGTNLSNASFYNADLSVFVLEERMWRVHTSTAQEISILPVNLPSSNVPSRIFSRHQIAGR